MTEAYREFLARKVCVADSFGFEVDCAQLNAGLSAHARAIVPWLCRGGRRALFASFGLQKTVMQLEAVRLAAEHADGPGLIVLPLGVRQEFRRDAVQRLGWSEPPAFIRGADNLEPGRVYLTNYETVRDGKLDPKHFVASSLDEADVLRGFGGSKTFREFMALFAGDRKTMDSREITDGVRYRFVATATPSPNDHIELLAYAAYLGIMDVSAAKTRFFKRNSEKADELTIHPHKAAEFWMWVSTWALIVTKPSDILCTWKDTNSKAGSSGSSRSSGGTLASGSARASAADHADRIPTDCSQDATPVAAAPDRATAARERGLTRSGAACATVAGDERTRTGETTAAAESKSASNGSHTKISSQTWGSRQSEQPSNGGTTTETTSLETASGQAERLRPETLDAQSASPTPEKHSLSPHGQRNSAPTTGSCTLAINSAGRRKECSPACAEGNCPWDEGYVLPGLDLRWHEIPTDHSVAGHEKDGQARMFANAAVGVQDAAREKRRSLEDRIAKMLEIRAEDPAAHRILWHDLEDERRAIERAVPTVRSVYGSQDLDEREASIIGFSDGEFQELAAKPSIAGAGCNFQRHCSWAIFLGIGFKFRDLIQAIHRIQRFLQTRTVRIDLIYTEAEREIRRDLERKWRQHGELQAELTAIVREYGLANASAASELTRAMGVKRIEASGDGWRCVNNDCVLELPRVADNSVGLIVTSIPFATQYEYSPNYADFGHTDNNAHFFAQMDYLTPHLLRVLQPGRVAAIHVKDRVVPGGLTGLGFQTVYRFSDKVCDHFEKHGFAFMSRKTVVTDVVRENNQTYRLGWTEQCKDATKMGTGLPEYVLLFRKPPTDTSNSYADVPVAKSKDDYRRARWQFDAHGFARSSGNRRLMPEELEGLEQNVVFKLFRQHSLANVYDFEHDVRIAEYVDAHGWLPSTFMLLQPQSWHPDVWTDVTRMRTLNGMQHAKGREMHLCPLQFDICDRVIAQFSNRGDTVLDPFAGLGTVVERAIRLRRQGVGIELATNYFLDGVAYCKAAEREMSMPSLFDLPTAESEVA